MSLRAVYRARNCCLLTTTLPQTLSGRRSASSIINSSSALLQLRTLLPPSSSSSATKSQQCLCRAYTTTPALSSAGKGHGGGGGGGGGGGAQAPSKTQDPLDTTQLSTTADAALSRLREELGKLRPGGRFNPEVLDGLRVTLQNSSGGREQKSGNKKKTTKEERASSGAGEDRVRLGEIAQVVPKGGRVVEVVAGEVEHIGPISTAIAASSYSLNPQPPTPRAPTTITIPLPPPTAESRKAVLGQVNERGEQAKSAIQKARAEHSKSLRAMQLAKTVRPDDLKLASKRMEAMVGLKNEEVKKAVEAARKRLES